MFQSLTDRFPTSEALFTWLRSPEGGRLIIRDDWMTPTVPLVMIYSEKGVSDRTLPHVRFFRSVVWDALLNRPVCVGPTHSSPFESLTDADVATAMVEDFVDGVMVNVFYAYDRWFTATRRVLDGDCAFYGERPFSALFAEAMATHGLTLSHLNPAATYSFVLQHPEERVVVAPAFGTPTLFLVDTTDPAPHEALRARLPVRHTGLATVEDVKTRVTAWGIRHKTAWQGVVIKCADGRRMKLQSEPYLQAQALRGNEQNRPYLWLSHWTTGTLRAYLRLYPEEEHAANAVVDAFKELTKQAHQVYQDVYRNRLYPLGQAPQKFRKLLWDAHTANKAAYFPTFRTYMNELDIARKLWLVNWEKRFGSSAPA